MKILFVGDNDVVGKYTAGRLFKEGHKISWLTSKESGELWGNEVKGTVYRTSPESALCKNIFKANAVDIVIFMTSDHRDNVDQDIDIGYRSILPALMNILKLSSDFKIKQFIFLSSTELYEKGGITPILADLMAGELLCSSWKNKQDMPILTLRLSSVYGADEYNHMGYIGHISKMMIDNKDIDTTYDKMSSVDFLYSEDAGDAIYRAILYEKTGKYNLCSGKRIGIESVFKTLSDYHKYSGKIRFAKEGNNKRLISINANKVKEELGWMPMYDFEDKIVDVLDKSKILNRYNQESFEEKRFSRLSWFMKKAYPFLENILLFTVLTFVLGFTKEYTDFRFVDIRLVYVVIMACTYGTRQSIIAVTLACISYGYSIVNAGIDLTYLIYSVDTWTPFIMYIITGASVGYVFDKKRDDMDAIKEEHNILNKKYVFLKGVYKQMSEIKDQLQRQIAASKDSFGRVYEITTQLDAFKPELIFYKAITILEDIMDSDSVCIYTINPEDTKYARLMANSVNLAGTLKSSLLLEEFPELQESIKDNKLFVNKKLMSDYPSYAAPILDGEDIVAVVMIYDIDFEKYNMYYQNLFKIITDLVQNNLVKAYKHNKDYFIKPYIEGTKIYKPEEYKEQIKIIQTAHEDIKLEYFTARIGLSDVTGFDALQLYEQVEPLLRNTDFMGYDGEGRYHLVLMQTQLKYIERISDRFKKKGITFQLEANE